MTSNQLSERSRPRPHTNRAIPHTQIGIQPVPEINTDLFRRCYSLPDVQNRPTVISIPGARALWLREGLPLVHPEVIVRGREFAHIHPDGSLHVALPPERANEAVKKGWAEPHPMAKYLDIEGMVMLYTPLDLDELDVVFGLILDSYNFVTGQNLRPENVFSDITTGEK